MKNRAQKIKFVGAVTTLACFLVSGCSTNLNRGSFGGFHRSLNITSHGYQVIPDPTGTAPSKNVERFEVRPGDCTSQYDWSDCRNDRERSELAESGYTPDGTEFWYGWHMYLPKDFPNISPTKTVMGQFHQKNTDPAWLFQHARDDGYYIGRSFGSTSDYAKLISSEDLREKWNKVQVHVLWHTSNGFFKVYVNDELKYKFNGKTSSGTGIYFKYGVYRSFISSYRNAYEGKNPATQFMYFSNVKRASTREGLEPSAD